MTISLSDIPTELWVRFSFKKPIFDGYQRKQFTQCDDKYLDRAQTLAEQIHCLTLFSFTSKGFYEKLKTEKDRLTKLLITNLNALSPHHFKTCVETGWYLFPLRIYYFYCANALYNKRDDVIIDLKIKNRVEESIRRGEIKLTKAMQGSKGTILHNAVFSPYGVSATSIPFLKYLLELNKTYALGLLNCKDQEGRTPSQLKDKMIMKGKAQESKKNTIIGLLKPA